MVSSPSTPSTYPSHLRAGWALGTTITRAMTSPPAQRGTGRWHFFRGPYQNGINCLKRLWRPSPWIVLSPDCPHISKQQTKQTNLHPPPPTPPPPSFHASPLTTHNYPPPPPSSFPPPPTLTITADAEAWHHISTYWMCTGWPGRQNLSFFFFFFFFLFLKTVHSTATSQKATESSIYWCWLHKGRRRCVYEWEREREREKKERGRKSKCDCCQLFALCLYSLRIFI